MILPLTTWGRTLDDMNKNTIIRIAASAATAALMTAGVAAFAPIATATADSSSSVEVTTLPAPIDRSGMTRPAPGSAPVAIRPLPAQLSAEELASLRSGDPQPVVVEDIAAPEAGFQGITAISFNFDGDDPEPICDPSGDYECVVPLGGGLELGTEGGIEYRDEYGNLVDPNPAPNPDGIDRSHLARGVGESTMDNATGGMAVAIALTATAVLGTGIALTRKNRTAHANVTA